MRKKLSKKIVTILLIGTLFATFGFLTGFVYPGNPLNADNTPYIGTGSTTFNESGQDDHGEDLEMTEDTNGESQDGQEIEEDEQEIETWVCGNCGYIYNPVVGDPEHGIIAGTEFDALPDTWICPVCGQPRSQFDSEDSQDIKTPEEWLAHLEHVLAMRSKHLVVLQRVIDAKIAKDPLLHSILSVQHALISSSNAVNKAQAAVDEYKAYIASLTTTTTDTTTTDTTTTDTTTVTTDTTDQTLTTQGAQNTITSDNGENGKGNKNKEEKGNKGKGKGKGKNK